MALFAPSGRMSIGDSSWKEKRRTLIIASTMSGITLLLLILANLSYLYGSTFHQAKRAHKLKILAVDFDRSDVGSSVIEAARTIEGKTYATVEFGSVDEYSDAAAVRRAVCRADYWAAVIVNGNATKNLEDALSAGSQDYDSSTAITYTYNQARYSVMGDSILLGNIQEIVRRSRIAFFQSEKAETLVAGLDGTDLTRYSALFDPIGSSPDFIQPTTQVGRVFFNTVNIVMAPLMQFFFVLALNGIAMQVGFFTNIRIRHVWFFRFIMGKAYTLLSGLVTAGYIWAFKENWDVDGAAFMKSWMLFWFLMDIQFQIMESVIGSFLPMQYSPFFVFTWIITNVASTVFPLDLMPGWYKIGYALPSREAYTVMVEIWSGCARQKHIALPVLFAWWIITHITAVFSVRKRCADIQWQVNEDRNASTGVLEDSKSMSA